MRFVIGEVIPLALVVALSPINVIPSILLLFSERPGRNASLFLAGFMGGVGSALIALTVLADLIGFDPGSGHSSWAAWLRIFLGAYLLVAAVRKFRSRPRAGEDGTMPAWMDGVTEYSGTRSLGLGVGLGAGNPKNLAVGLAAAVAITGAGLPGAQQVAVIAVYVAIAMLGVVAPLVAMLVLGSRATEVLDGWKIWLRQSNATIMSVLFLVFGVVLLSQGFGSV